MSERALVVAAHGEGRWALSVADGGAMADPTAPPRERLGSVASLDAALARVDVAVHEAVVIVGPGGVERYVVFPLSVPDGAVGTRAPNDGVLLRVRGREDAARVGGWVDGFRAAVGASLGRGALDCGTARELLVAEARGWTGERRVRTLDPG